MRNRIRWLVLGVFVLLSARPALAQLDEIWIDFQWRNARQEFAQDSPLSRVNSYEQRAMVWYLDLDAQQLQSLSDLSAALESDEKRAREALEEYQRFAYNEIALNDDGKNGSGVQLGQTEQRFYEHHRRLEQQFIDDVRALLSDAQINRWTLVEAASRRADRLGFSNVLSLARVDLMGCAQAGVAGGIPSQTLLDAIVAWEHDMRPHIDRLYAWRDEWRAMIERRHEEGGDATDLHTLRSQKNHEIYSDIWRITKAHRGRVQDALPVEGRARFLEAFYSAAAFGQATPSHRHFDYLGVIRQFNEIPGVSAEQHGEFEGVVSDYWLSRWEAFERLVEIIEAREVGRVIEGPRDAYNDDFNQNPAAALDIIRQAIPLVRRAREILTPEQLTGLPPPIGLPPEPPVFE